MPDWKDISFNPRYDDGWQTIPNPSDGPRKNTFDDGWRTIPNPSDGPAWYEDPILPAQEKSDVPEFKNTLRNLGVENETLIDAAALVPRFGEWAYENVARPATSLAGAGMLGAAATGPLGAAGVGLLGAGMGAYSAYHHVPQFYENPTFEGGLDLANDALMVFGGYHGAKTLQKGYNPYSALEKIAEAPKMYREPTQEPLPLTSDYIPDPDTINWPQPSAPRGPRMESPGRGTLQDTAIDLNARDQSIQNIVRSTGRPVFDVDPFADINDALRGAEIGTRAADGAILESIKLETNPDNLRNILTKYGKILSEGLTKGTDAEVDMAHKIYNAALEKYNAVDPEYNGRTTPDVDLGGQQVLPIFGIEDIPSRGVSPEGPHPLPPSSDVQLSLPMGERGPGTADFNNVYTQLKQMLGRDPSAADLEAAMARSAGEGDTTGQVAPFPGADERFQMEQQKFNDQIGVAPSAIPESPVDLAINKILRAYIDDPGLTLVQMQELVDHLPPAEQQRALQQALRLTTQSRTNTRKPPFSQGDPLANVPDHNPAWEETPEEASATDWPPGSNIVPEQTPQPSGTQGQLPFGPMDLTRIPEPPTVPEPGRVGQPELPLSGDYRAIREANPLVHSPVPGGEGGPRDPIPTVSIGRIVDKKRQALEQLGIDSTGMTGWEADMALQRANRAREVPSGEQMMLGLEDSRPQAQLPEIDQVRQKDVLKVATLMEAGMVNEAQQIRQLHEMYGRPITNAEEVAALAEHYTRMGDTEKAAKYNELADRYSAVEQGQQDMFKPNSFEGGAPNDPNQMSQEWMDEQNGRIPPKGPLGVRPGFGKASGMVPDPPAGQRQRAAVVRQHAVDDIIRNENKVRDYEKQAKAALETGNPQLAEQFAGAAELHRKQAATANIEFAKKMRGQMRESERFEAMARAREAAGDTEGAARLNAQANTEYLREAGQLELRFRKNFLAQKMREMGFELSDKTIRDIENLDPANLSHALQKDFAELVFAGVDEGPPGLSVQDIPSERPHITETHITIRDNNGKPIAHAEMRTNKFTKESELVNWAVDQDAGMGQQAVLPLAMELEKRGGLVPKGPYSQDTKTFLQRLVTALKSEKGATPIFTGGGKRAGGKWWDRLKDAAGWGQGYKTNKRQRAIAKQQVQMIDEFLAMPANMTTTGDLSAPGRQGLMLFHTPEFWNAMGAMFRGISPKAFDHIDMQLKNMRIMQSQGTDPKTGKPLPSMAEKWGMKMFEPASKPGPHAKAAASNWLETGRFFNYDIPYLTKGWAKSPFAMIVRGSNRAFITFANHLNVNRLQYLADRAQDNSLKALKGEVRKQGLLGGVNPREFRFGIGKYMPDVNIGFSDRIDFSTASKSETRNWNRWAENLDPYNNTELGKELADTVNTLTGHAPLRTHFLPFRGAEVNLEKHARLLGRIFFAPGLLASRVRAMNPSTYIMASPMVRKQMIGGLFGAASGYTASVLLLKNASKALGYDSEIETNTNSADAFKVRVGNYRMDPSGGIAPYLVLYSRLISGYYTSSSTGKTTELGQGYQATTASTLTDRFLTNKQEPIAKFVSDMLAASEHQPVYMKDRMLQMMIPMVAQDIYEVSKEDPGLIPLSVGSFFGHGAQVYKEGVAGTKFTNPKTDWQYAGGGLRGLVYGADFQNKQSGVGPRQMGPRRSNARKLGPRQPTPRQ